MRALARRVGLLFGILLVTPALASSQTVTAVWDPNPTTDLVTSYEICVGTTSLSCDFKNVSVPATQTSYTFSPAAGVLYRVAVRAVSAAGAGAYAPEVSVSIPAISTQSNRTSTVNSAITPVTITATDPDGSPLQFSHTGLPFGLTLNQSTGVISGTPTTTGTFNVTVFVTDGLATSAAAFVWTIQSGASDTTAPNLSITSHTSGQTVSSPNITLAGTASDGGAGGSGITGVTVNGAAASGGTASGTNTANWSRAVTLVAGANVLTVVATDGAGNARTSQITINYTASSDTTAPTLTITSHTSGQTVTTTAITLAGTATDSGTGGSGITGVTVNGAAATGGTATGSNTANWSCNLSLVGGSNVVTVVATDGAGNARTAQFTINVSIADTAAPSLTITSHTSGQAVNTSNITLAGTATDSGTGGSGITSVTVNGLSASGDKATGSATANWSRNVAISTGANVFTIVASDGAGNARQSQITINGDSTAPSLAITSHTNGQTVTTSTITVSGTATDSGTGGNGIVSVTVNGGGATGGTATGSATSNWSRYITLTAGTNAITVVARDGAGNSRTSTLSVTYAVTDATPPSLAITSHTNGQTVNSANITLSGTATDSGAGGSGITSVTVNGAAATGGTASGTATANWSSALTLVSGTNTVTVVARDGAGNSRTLTISIAYTPVAGVTAISATPNAGSGTTQTFALQYGDTLGATDLSQAWVWFGTTTSSSVNACLVFYDRPSATVFLENDAATQWVSAPLGSGVTMQNSQCMVSLAGSSVTTSGNTLTLKLAVTFSPAFAGTKNIYLFGRNAKDVNSGWQARGTWTTLGGTTVTADSATPNAGSGTTQTFALQYSDTLGATDLSQAWVWFGTTLTTSANACLVFYDRPSAKVFLQNDTATEWVSAPLGSGVTMQNSQCMLSLAGSSVTTSGNTLTLNLAVTFLPAFTGTKNIYLFGRNAKDVNSGWQARGTWATTTGTTVTAGSATPNAGSGTTQTFALQYSDTSGATDLSQAWVWFGTTLTTSANACLLFYDRPSATVFLENDAATQWMAALMGSGATLQNSQCAVSLAGSSVTTSGNTLTLKLAMTFKPAFAGTKNIYLFGRNAKDVNSGWQTRGSWSVP